MDGCNWVGAKMNPVDRVLELLDLEAAECPESWMQAGLDVLLSREKEITRQAARIRQLESHLIRERERYIDDFVHEFDECEDRSEEAREQLQAEGKL